eukprot:6341295-Alexandrium_andersonii.AAC.1
MAAGKHLRTLNNSQVQKHTWKRRPASRNIADWNALAQNERARRGLAKRKRVTRNVFPEGFEVSINALLPQPGPHVDHIMGGTFGGRFVSFRGGTY